MLDHVLVTPPYPGLDFGEVDQAAIGEFYLEAGNRQYDLALQFAGGGINSNRYTVQLGASLTVGHCEAGAVKLDFCLPYAPRRPEVLRFLDLARLVGAKPTSTDIELPISLADERELEQLDPPLDRQRLAAGGYVGVHLGSRSGARCWPSDRFAAVLRALLSEFDLRALLLGESAEAPRALAVIQGLGRLGRRVDNLVGKTSLGALIALIAKLTLFLGNDSGPAHMADALNVPSVVVFGSAHPLQWQPITQTWHRVVADWQAPCHQGISCGCPDDPTAICLQGVQPAAVWHEVRELLRLQEQVRKARARSSC